MAVMTPQRRKAPRSIFLSHFASSLATPLEQTECVAVTDALRISSPAVEPRVPFIG